MWGTTHAYKDSLNIRQGWKNQTVREYKHLNWCMYSKHKCVTTIMNDVKWNLEENVWKCRPQSEKSAEYQITERVKVV